MLRRSGLGDRLELFASSGARRPARVFSRFVPAREWGVGRGVGEGVSVYSRALSAAKQPLIASGLQGLVLASNQLPSTRSFANRQQARLGRIELARVFESSDAASCGEKSPESVASFLLIMLA